jgi:hypothetical protein
MAWFYKSPDFCSKRGSKKTEMRVLVMTALMNEV